VPRSSRIVVPGLPHHIIQRGNRREPIFFCDNDRQYYLRLLRERMALTVTRCLSWCLMDNHVHLILIPASADSLRATLAPVHTRYAARINRLHDWTGHLFEGRYWSYPMDEAHLMRAMRYVENNPVQAGLVAHAEDWRWSSAAAHIEGGFDALIGAGAPGAFISVSNWRAYLREGAEAADRDEAIEIAMRSGKPLGNIRAPVTGVAVSE
jgi:putative transposase